MKKKILITTAIILVLVISYITTNSITADDRYDFNIKNGMHACAAYLMCSTIAFSTSECQDVFKECWSPGNVISTRHDCGWFCSYTTYSTKCNCGNPGFSVTAKDEEEAHEEAKRRLAEQEEQKRQEEQEKK